MKTSFLPAYWAGARRHETHRGHIAELGLFAAGVGLAYLLDPQRGRQRRTIIRDRLAKSGRRGRAAAEKVARDLRNRTYGVIAEARSHLHHEPVEDRVLAERVRSELGRVLTYPRAVTVQVDRGCVALHGSVPVSEHRQLLSTARSIQGVEQVEDKLTIIGDGDVAPRPGPQFALMQANWPPAARLLSGLAGSALVFAGISRGKIFGAGLSLSGLALLTRALTNVELRRLVALDGEDDAEGSGDTPAMRQPATSATAPLSG